MKHELPTYPGEVAKLFRAACEVWDAERVEQLKDAVRDYVVQFEQLTNEYDVGDLELANTLAGVSQMLLARYQSFNNEQKALVIGAVRYFVEDADPIPDSGFAAGLIDDAQVLNHVLELIGIEDHYIPLADVE